MVPPDWPLRRAANPLERKHIRTGLHHARSGTIFQASFFRQLPHNFPFPQGSADPLPQLAMRVRYTAAHVRPLATVLKEIGTFHSLADLPLTVGQESPVYAVGIQSGRVRFYIVDDNVLRYPLAYAAELFDIVEGSIPPEWHFALTPSNLDYQAIMTIREWVTEDYFYDKLTDGVARERALFEQMVARVERG